MSHLANTLAPLADRVAASDAALAAVEARVALRIAVCRQRASRNQETTFAKNQAYLDWVMAKERLSIEADALGDTLYAAERALHNQQKGQP